MFDTQYIELRKGDDSDFNGREIVIQLDKVDSDMTNWTAVFKLGTIIKNFSNFGMSKEIVIVLSAQDTMSLSVGKIYGYLQCTDERTKTGTLDFVIPFKILGKVV